MTSKSPGNAEAPSNPNSGGKSNRRKGKREIVEPMIPHAHRDEAAAKSLASQEKSAASHESDDAEAVEPMIPHRRRADMES